MYTGGDAVILVVEGIDGCGKTQVCAAVARALAHRLPQLVVAQMAFPNRTTPTGVIIDAHLRSTVGRPTWLDPYAHQALQVVNRLERLPELVDPGRVNVLSRYTTSAFVYGALDGCELAWLARVTAALPDADLHVLLACDPAVALARMRARGVTSDAYERRGVDWFTRAAERYEALWQAGRTQQDLEARGGLPSDTRLSPTVWLRLDATAAPVEALAANVVRTFMTLFSCECGKAHNRLATTCEGRKVRHG